MQTQGEEEAGARNGRLPLPMMTIILCGKPSDAAVSSWLFPVLSSYGGVQYFCGGRLGGDRVARYLLLDCERLPDSALESGILLFKKSFRFYGEKKAIAGLVPVFSSSHTGAAVFLKGTGLSAITYGMSNKDTISLAGLDDAGASVSIQRTVRALDGTEIEPGDIRVRLKKPHSAEQVLLLSTVLLLCGETPEFRF